MEHDMDSDQRSRLESRSSSVSAAHHDRRRSQQPDWQPDHDVHDDHHRQRRTAADRPRQTSAQDTLPDRQTPHERKTTSTLRWLLLRLFYIFVWLIVITLLLAWIGSYEFRMLGYNHDGPSLNVTTRDIAEHHDWLNRYGRLVESHSDLIILEESVPHYRNLSSQLSQCGSMALNLSALVLEFADYYEGRAKEFITDLHEAKKEIDNEANRSPLTRRLFEEWRVFTPVKGVISWVKEVEPILMTLLANCTSEAAHIIRIAEDIERCTQRHNSLLDTATRQTFYQKAADTVNYELGTAFGKSLDERATVLRDAQKLSNILQQIASQVDRDFLRFMSLRHASYMVQLGSTELSIADAKLRRYAFNLRLIVDALNKDTSRKWIRLRLQE